MKLVISGYSLNSSPFTNETEAIDHYFRISNLQAIHSFFAHHPDKINSKEPKVKIT